MKILYVEDDTNVSDVARRLFLKTDHDFIVCETVADAKKLLVEKYVDVVILDLMFPGGLCGVDLLKFYEENDIFTPVIIYSGYIDEYAMREIQAFIDIGIVTHVFIKGQNSISDVIRAVGSIKMCAH